MEKKRFLAGSVSIALAVTMFSTTAFAASVKFTDVPDSHWAASSITEMADKGIMSGIGNNLFAPSNTLTGAEFVTMIVRHFYEDKLGTEGEKWYSEFMDAAKSANILTGTSITAEDVINRYDMSQLMYNVLKAEGITTSSLSDTSKVADWSAVPSTYRDAVSVCYNMGMLSGIDSKGTFNGNGVMDRAQAAVVMDRLLEVCSGGTPSTPSGVQEGRRNTITGEDVVFSDSKDFYKDGIFHFPFIESKADWTGGRCESYFTVNVTGYDYLVLQDVKGQVSVYNGDTKLASTGFDNVSCDVKGLTEVVVRVSAYRVDGGATCSIILGNYAVVEHHIPAGAMELTNDNILHLIGEGSKYENGVFYLKNSGFEGSGGCIQWVNNGYSTLTFTVTVHDKDHYVAVSDYGNVVVDGRLGEVLEAGASKTYSVNIAGLKNMGIAVRSGRFCNAEVTNIYLS